MVVKAYVNGMRGSFIVDTGAETLILNEKYFTGKENNQNHAVDFNGSKVRYKETNVKFGWEADNEKTKFAYIELRLLIQTTIFKLYKFNLLNYKSQCLKKSYL